MMSSLLPSPMESSISTFDSSIVRASLGAAFLGCIFMAMLYGLNGSQAYTFYKTSHDTHVFKALIGFLLVLDTVHTAFVIHLVYYYCILLGEKGTGFAIVTSPVWSLMAAGYLVAISDAIVRSIYGRRVWLLSKRYKILVFVIGLLIITVFATSIVAVTKLFMGNTIEDTLKLIKFQPLFYVAIGGGIVGDIIIAGSLCYTLSLYKTGFSRKTDSAINIIIMYTINTGLLTTLLMIAMLITFVALPPTIPVYCALWFSLSKLYCTSLFAALNSREGLWQKCFESTRGVATTGKDTLGSDHGRRIGTQQPVIMVNIERKVTVDEPPSSLEKDNRVILPSYHVSASGSVM